MATYKLIYFNAKGRGEVARMILSQAGVQFEDYRVSGYGGEDWAKLKPTTPTGMIPVLEVDGKPLTGSGPIDRFLAERFGLAGSNDFENAQVAGIIDVAGDFFGKLVALYLEKEEDRKASLKKQLEEEYFPKYWGVLEKMIQKNGSEGGWSFGSKPTYADFNIFCVVDYALIQFPNILESYPGIAKLKSSVEALPNIAKWLKERPQTLF